MGFIDPGPELLILVALILILVFNPKQMAPILRFMGRLFTQYQHAKQEINREVRKIQREAERELDDAKGGLGEVVEEFRNDLKGMSTTLQDGSEEMRESFTREVEGIVEEVDEEMTETTRRIQAEIGGSKIGIRESKAEVQKTTAAVKGTLRQADSNHHQSAAEMLRTQRGDDDD